MDNETKVLTTNVRIAVILLENTFCNLITLPEHTLVTEAVFFVLDFRAAEVALEESVTYWKPFVIDQSDGH